MIRPTCSVPGCDRPARSSGAKHCEAHYYRLRRSGDVGGAAIQEHRRGAECSIAGCAQPARGGRGWCHKHYTRWVRHGSPEAFVEPANRKVPKGDETHWWTGDDVTYSGMHQRVRKVKGLARDHACVDCGGKGSQWSYDRLDPDERRSEFGPYSVSLDHYVSRCVPCHKRFDLAAVRS